MRRGTRRYRKQLRGGVTFKNNTEVKEYAIPDFSNLFNSTNTREINENIVAYYNGRKPFHELNSSKGHTIKYPSPGLQHIIHQYSRPGISAANRNAAIKFYKNKINSQAKLRTLYCNYSSKLGAKTVNNVQPRMASHPELINNSLINKILLFNNANQANVEYALRKSNRNLAGAHEFAKIYNSITINNDNTNASITEKFLNKISDVPAGPLRNYLLRRIRSYHRSI